MRVCYGFVWLWPLSESWLSLAWGMGEMFIGCKEPWKFFCDYILHGVVLVVIGAVFGCLW